MCQSINSETHCTFSYIDICLEHGEVEANGTSVATAAAAEPQIILQQQSRPSFSPNPVMAKAVEPEIQPQEQIVQSRTSTLGIPDAPVTTDENTLQNSTEMLQTKVEDVMKEVCNMDSDLDEFVSRFQKDRIISEVQEILNLFEKNCQIKGCVGECAVVNTKSEGGVLIVSWKCTRGHSGIWESSAVLCVKRGQKVYAATVLLAASIVVSENNFDKLSMLMKFLNVSYLSESTFSRIQMTCVTPVVKELWEAMKAKVWEVLKGEELALAGDGRNDSPGHSAKYCV